MNWYPSEEPSASTAWASSQQAAARRWKRMLFVALGVVVLCGAVLLLYGRTLHAPFIFDDAATVLTNPSILKLWPLFGDGLHDGPLRPTANRPTSARPLVNLSLAINYHFGRFEPAGYRGVNIALHAVSALLI